MLETVEQRDGDVFEVTREAIDKQDLESRIIRGAAGAVVTFDGIVRNQTHGRPVLSLQYEADRKSVV